MSHYFISTAPNKQKQTLLWESKKEKITENTKLQLLHILFILNYKNATDAQLSNTTNSKNIGEHI